MQPNIPGEDRGEDPLELCFPHIKLATPEDEQLNKSLLEALSPASPTSSAPYRYRLPKLSSSGSVSASSTAGSDHSDGAGPGPVPLSSSQDERTPRSVRMRKGGKNNVAKLQSRGSSRSSLPNPPYTIAQLRRAQNIHVPSFKRAQFAPIITSPARPVETPNVKREEEKGEEEVEEANDNLRDIHVRVDPRSARASTRFSQASRTTFGSRSAAASTTIPMATGSVYSRPPPPDQKAEWRLSPYRHKNFDNQAVSKGFGPYSRGFVIHCAAPKSWLHMKLRRSKTTLT